MGFGSFTQIPLATPSQSGSSSTPSTEMSVSKVTVDVIWPGKRIEVRSGVEFNLYV
jgi:hypothetical protein